MQNLKKPFFYALFFFMVYLLGLSFVFSQAQIQKQYLAFSPVSVINWLFGLGMGVWLSSLLLQLFKRLWIEHQKAMQRLQAALGLLSLLSFAINIYWVWKNQAPPPIGFTWLILAVLSLTLLVNLAFAVARMHTKSAIEKAGPVLYPAFAMLTLLATILVPAR